MIKGHNPGDNITLMNTMFKRGLDTEGDFHEYLTIVYKDCDSGQKFAEEIVDPDYEYYVAKEDKRVDYPRLFIPIEDTYKVTVPHRELELDIAKRIGAKDFYYANLNNGNRGENKKLHMHPDIFNSDNNIEDHYRFRFGRLYKNEVCKISKSYFDIEVDSISMMGDFPEPGECPVNAISLILQDQQRVFTFLLRNKANPQIAEFEKSVNDGSVFPELTNFVINAVGGPKIAANYNINFTYNFLFYDEDDEINLIKDLFNAINNFKPDFALAWNMSFDLPYLIARCKKLGYDPRDIMCNPDFKYKIAEYFVDERMKNEFAERGDFALISSYTTFLDQMIHFASRRKGQNKFISFTLDFIGEAVAKVKKLDYKHITTNISELPYKDYKTFVFYNIMDTVVQYCIEACTGDLEFIFGKCNINNTRYSKGYRQTVYLTNRGIKEFYNTDNGYIMGNNINKFNPKPTEKFPGAFVADPRQLNGYSKMTIYGRLIDVLNNLVDFDYASLYPSIIRQFNIAPNTQIGMVIIDQQVYENENKCKFDNWTRAGAFMEDFQSQVWLEICTRWFGLADYTTLYHEVEWFFENIANAYNGIRDKTKDGLTIPVVFRKPELLIEPVEFKHDYEFNVEDRYLQPDTNAWKGWRDNAIATPNQQY